MIPINEAIERISKALERRSGRAWTVTTLENAGLPEWLRVTTTVERFVYDKDRGHGMTDMDRDAVASMCGLCKSAPFQGKLIPPDHRMDYLDRIENSRHFSYKVGGLTDPPENTKCPGCDEILTAETIAYFEAKQSQDPPYYCHNCRTPDLTPPTDVR